MFGVRKLRRNPVAIAVDSEMAAIRIHRYDRFHLHSMFGIVPVRRIQCDKGNRQHKDG